ncbi:hypothetical protein CWC14_01410 [Pseudoalteromonas sp. S3260]|uniref:hypothetical protein n=1 Tax=Pseudoalteromonas sp. S3260 TaxID=579534 RepID=UPI00110A1482|nr:hypothetical protein [Pseudoalteromonas sp. S3260]TMP00912.1 hypothetical protein CWC14_01410 [Pseudoalteromonas sp. S3260]
MSINFDVVIESDDYSVDMQSGLETLKGASEATRQIATTIIERRVPQKLSSESKVRTNLKKSFRGSYGQQFSLDFYDEEAKKRFRSIGKQTISELISYFINEALYQESLQLSGKAKNVLKNLGEDLEGKLIKQLQKSSLEHLHSVANNFNKDVKIRFRKNQDTKTTLANLGKATYATLKPLTNKNKIEITASITRLNINTGNGRLLVKGEDETVAFGFPAQKQYGELKFAAKQKFSDNLHSNNGIPSENWKTLKLKAHTQRTSGGQIIKYLIEGFNDA